MHEKLHELQSHFWDTDKEDMLITEKNARASWVERVSRFDPLGALHSMIRLGSQITTSKEEKIDASSKDEHIQS